MNLCLHVSAISEVLFCSACHVWELYGVPVYQREASIIEGVLIHTAMIYHNIGHLNINMQTLHSRYIPKVKATDVN